MRGERGAGIPRLWALALAWGLSSAAGAAQRSFAYHALEGTADQFRHIRHWREEILLHMLDDKGQRHYGPLQKQCASRGVPDHVAQPPSAVSCRIRSLATGGGACATQFRRTLLLQRSIGKISHGVGRTVGGIGPIHGSGLA
jgi:hypothetical protein